MAVSVLCASTITITETLDNTPSAADASKRVVHSDYNESATYTSVTTPPVTKCASFLLTLSSGSGTIDFRALTGTNGASIDGNGLKVQMLRFKNLGENIMTITPGASNGIDLFGASSSLAVPPSGYVHMFFADASPDIAAGDKTIDIAGTGAQTAEVTVVVG